MCCCVLFEMVARDSNDKFDEIRAGGFTGSALQTKAGGGAAVRVCKVGFSAIPSDESAEISSGAGN